MFGDGMLSDFVLFYADPENNLYVSWQDSAMIPMLNASNILDYFTQRSNPFYERQCNNEVIKMQHASLDHLRFDLHLC